MYNEFSFKSNGVGLYCRKYGRGAPVIMVHGACTDCDFFHDSAEILSKHFCVCTYDRRGSGRSGDAADYSVSAQSEELAMLAGELGGRVDLVGHSAGAVIAMECISSHPELFNRILLHEPPVSCGSIRAPDDQKMLEKVSNFIKNEKYVGALAVFLAKIGEKDKRARESTDEELNNFDRDCSCFIKNEFFNIFNYVPEKSSLANANITIGIGELTHAAEKDYLHQQLASEIGADVVYFPGAHNGPFDLPKEFAYIAMGILGN